MSLISTLMQGGAYGHFWAKQSKETFWWPTGEADRIVLDPEEDLYFGVHPSTVRKGPRERTLEEDIAALNCLYADIDSKDFDDSKAKAAVHVKQLSPKPSVIVDSGGGYHCYWLLDKPFVLNTPFKRGIAQNLQERWVFRVGGDGAVHDLARILRIPGTLNHKYDPPRPIRVLHANYARTFTVEQLQALLPPEDEHRGDDEDLVIPRPKKSNDLTFQEIVDLACAAKGGERFKQLWSGGSVGYDSTSEADLAFCCLLAFWTGGDYTKIDKLFRASKRMRDKWDREEYRHSTITKALGQVTQFYTDPGGYLTAGAHDEGNAQCVYARTRKHFAFCSALGWLRNKGTHWESRGAEAALDLGIPKVLKARRAAAARNGTSKMTEAIIRASKPSATNVRNCKTLVKPMLTMDISEFDKSPDELNCVNGVLDLRSGTLTSHNSNKKFTYCLPVEYDPKADQSAWTSWLLEATGGRQEVVDYLQEALGYSITGQTREEAIFYIWGPTRGGKGIFTETLLHLLGLGVLAVEVGMESFLEKKHSSDEAYMLAYLRSTRFVAASESKTGHWLDAAKIKRWTGGNLVTCRQIYGKPFSYIPQFKIWLTSNFPPRMNVDDIAAWERLRVMSFPNSWLGREDKMLKKHMRSPEVLKGVLAWIIEGAVKWYKRPRKGLQAPQIIKEATKVAQDNLDWVMRWIEEDGLVNTGRDDDRVSIARLRARYEDWCEDRGVSPRKWPALKASLERLGFVFPKKALWLDGKASKGATGVKFVSRSFREDLSGVGQGADLNNFCKDEELAQS